MKRVLLKLSGEAFLGKEGAAVDLKSIHKIALEIKSALRGRIQLGIVIGGGNIWRGARHQGLGIERAASDNMGMLATLINSLALQNIIEKIGPQTRVMSAINCANLAEQYIRRRAIRHMEKGRVVIFAAGTGNPYFSTDTAAALRASEIGADLLIKATNVDGVYSGDPRRKKNVKLYKTLTMTEALSRRLSVMDAAALVLARENKIPIRVFNMAKKGNIAKAVLENQSEPSSDHKDLHKMQVGQIISEADKLMKKTLDHVHEEFATVRSNRASPAILEPVKVNYYGSPTPVNQVGTVAVTEGRTIEIRPWDVSVMAELEKAIMAANLGATPNSDGKVMRLVFPPLSEDRRKDLVKVVKKMAEDFRISLRNERRDAMDKLKKAEKDDGLPQDARKQAEEKIQGLTNAYIKQIDEAVNAKEKEILEI